MAAGAGEELQRLLAISSVSGDEGAMLAYLEQRCAGLGLATWRQQVDGDRHNLLVNPLPEPVLIITAHMDTVPEMINGRACRREIVGQRFYGRGAADVKGGMAALLTALAELITWGNLKAGEMPPVTLAFTVDEEREGKGSEELAKLGGHAAVVIEPTDLKLCTAQAGSVVMKAQIHGRSAHGSTLESGQNAVLRAMGLLHELGRLPVFRRSHNLIGQGGYNVQMISGGSREMAVPHWCELILDCRVLPGQTTAAVQQAVESLVGGRDWVDSRWLDVSGSYEIGGHEPVVALAGSCIWEALGEEPRAGGMPSWTDGENLHAAGIKPVIFGPGSLAVAHTGEEYIDLPEVVKAARVFAGLLTRAGELRT
jgi:acetylornithine deacetylase/succinyl-diaminopimelate desuccinylase